MACACRKGRPEHLLDVLAEAFPRWASEPRLHAGPYGGQRALLFHSDDALSARFRQRIETEQGPSARRPRHKRQATLPLWLQERIAQQDREEGGTPRESKPSACTMPRCGADPAPQARGGANRADRPAARARAAAAGAPWRDGGGAGCGRQGRLAGPTRAGAVPSYNAVLKRVLGNKGWT